MTSGPGWKLSTFQMLRALLVEGAVAGGAGSAPQIINQAKPTPTRAMHMPARASNEPNKRGFAESERSEQVGSRHAFDILVRLSRCSKNSQA